MDLPMYTNRRVLAETPHNHYITQLQALVNDRWENSTQTSLEIYQQTDIGSTDYTLVNISVDTAIDIGTGFKKGDDFKVFSHKDISYEAPLGIMFKTANDDWICINTNGFESPTNSIEVRRCNNTMKWIDPLTGNLNQQRCAIDYELSSPQPSKDKDVVAASGHIFVIVQGNDLTRSIRKNQRFIFNGQPYKVGAYQTMLERGMDMNYSTLLYIDMYLDMIQSSDDLENNIANATDYLYTVNIQPDVQEQTQGFVGQINATVQLNGEVVNRSVTWSAKNATIDENGNYELTGAVGTTAVITCTLSGNNQVFDICNIEIVESVKDTYDVIVEPSFEEVRYKQPMTFTVYLYQNGVRQDDNVTWGYSGLSNDNFTLIQDGNQFTLSVLRPSTTPLTLTFDTGIATKTIDIMLKPLF